MSELKVVITDERANITELLSPTGSKTIQEVNNQTATNVSREGKKANKAISYSTMYAMQTLDYITSNAAKWQGSVIGATRVNNAKTLISLGASAMVNPIGTALMSAFSLATTAVDYNFQRSIDSKASQASLKRAGYNSYGDIVGRRGQW